MTYSVLEVDIGRIYLDNNNPRHDPIQNESEIISHLIIHESVKQLARHIASVGSTSPLERIAVIDHPKVKDAYITAEGNRRICAIKLLADPDKADTEANKKYFHSLANGMVHRPNRLEAVVFKDMQSARPWLSLRHEGEQGGVGTRAWNSRQKARFNAQGNNVQNPNIQASLLMDYARAKHLLSSEEISALSITTLTRFLSNPVFRDMLGLVDNKTLTIKVPIEEFNLVVIRFLTDALNPVSGVNSRTSVAERKAYADKLRAEQVAPTTHGHHPIDLNAKQKSQIPERSASSPTETATRNNRSPNDRKKVVPSSFSAHIHDKILKRLYDELRDLDAEQFPFAATYLLRAVIEQMATIFLKKKGIPIQRELHNKLGDVAVILKNQGVDDRQLKALRTMSNDKDSRYSPDTLGNYVHGGAVPTRVDAIKAWDSIEPIITIVLAQLK